MASTSINPTSMANTLATAYTQAAQDQLTTQTSKAQATSTALNSLRSALNTFNSAVTSLSAKKGLSQNTATFSNPAIGSASATSTAQAGSYSFFVEKLATGSQVAYQDLPAAAASEGGPIVVQMPDGTTINVTLADADNDGTISQAEVARAINLAPTNQGKVTATTVSANGKTQLLLTAAQTGGAADPLTGVVPNITIDASGLPSGALQTALGAAPNVLAAAQNAVVWLGAQGSGIKLEQASNTFTSIPGVSIGFNQAMAAGATPVTLTVASDASGTAANVQTFVDAYNALNKTLDSLTAAGSADGKTSAGAFASDAGIRALRGKLSSILRQSFGGLSVIDLGVASDRSGVLSLDSSKLSKALAAHPDGLSQVFGSTATTGGSGLLGALNDYAGVWLNSANGLLKNRQDSVQRTQTELTDKQTRLDATFKLYYERYLQQFTALQTLQDQMSQTSDMFSSLSTSGN
ncbi:MAG: flagellar filament capping protein FliD [Proteobacteria bacterium]|nr:flagellar filament capping protein FliD [Pseudomonadota bacterium]